MELTMREGLGGFQRNLASQRGFSPDVVPHMMHFNLWDHRLDAGLSGEHQAAIEQCRLLSVQLQRVVDAYQDAVRIGMHPGNVRMSLPVGDVHISRALERMLVSYPNREYVADRVVPVVPVDKRFDSIFQLPVETMQTVADVIIAGQRARPNEMKYSINHTLNYNVKDYGLIDFISKDEIANADPPLRPYDYAQRVVLNALMLAREVRVATLAFTGSNYGANTSALAGAARWDTATGDPVADILTAMETAFIRPNRLAMGGQVWPKFRANPNVTKYILSRPSTKAGATPLLVDMNTVAQAFELDEVIVGRAKIATNAEGATLATGYVWGKSASLTYVEDAPNPRESKAFADTFRFGPASIQVQVIPELLHGVRGGDFIKLTHSDDEIVVGGVNSGYLYTTVIS